MAVLSIKSFSGIAPKVPARYLATEQAQAALNTATFSGSLQPLTGLGSTVHTLTKTGTPKTIYRFGQDTDSETKYWFHWTQEVDVCRSQIPGDTSEWTFYTGDGGPKATYNAIALSSANYPAVSRPLGLPAPAAPVTVSASTFTEISNPAKVTLTAFHISELTTTFDIEFSLNNESSYTTVALSATDITTVKNALDAATGISAEIEGNSIIVSTDATGEDVTLHVRYQTGTELNTDGTFTYASGTLDLQDTGEADSDPYIVLTDSEIGSISAGDKLYLISEDATHINGTAAPSTFTASTLASWITSALSGELTAVAYGSCVVITRGTSGTGTGSLIRYRRQVDTTFVTTIEDTFSESADPARIIVTSANVTAVQDSYISVIVNGVESFVQVPDYAQIGYLYALEAYGLSVEFFGDVDPIAVVTTSAIGTSATVRIRAGSFPSVAKYSTLSGLGSVDQPESLETRVYAWTWVNKEAGFEFESAPSPASNSVDVRSEQSVEVTGFASVPTGYVVTHKRLYRSVSGVYLFVAEITAATASYTDEVKAEDLGEELPTLTWAEPPSTLRGLINLPNGVLAGFSGRDILFSHPYRPHAWPQEYIQTVDYPVVGLGRMDTTLAVLTKGTPYFIQGSDPASSVVVKSDLEQACIAKRSIVSTGGVVFYASPDGLVMLSPGGSKVITEGIFSRSQWQSYFRPESIHAYQHDLKYIAFYDNGTTQGGFIFDMTSGQFIQHSVYVECGYTDLQQDKLFLANASRELKKWLEGSNLAYTWKSKIFTFPHPTTFSCARVQAETYPVTAKFYKDGSLIHTQTVANRAPFRLPATSGRDWEVQLEGTSEVFAVDVAHAVQELANV